MSVVLRDSGHSQSFTLFSMIVLASLEIPKLFPLPVSVASNLCYQVLIQLAQ